MQESRLQTLLEKSDLHDMIESFYTCIRLPIQVIDEHGNVLDSFGGSGSFCTAFRRHLPPDDLCETIHTNASKRAASLGESYIFSCHAQLSHIVFPLLYGENYIGSILLGPFLMNDPDSILISDIAKRYHINLEDSLELFEDLSSIPVIPPARVNYINKLLYYLFRTLVSDSKELYRANSSKLVQQSRINESIQRYKNTNIVTKKYPYEKEKELLTKVKTGNLQEAKAILNDLLGYVLFSEGNSLDIVKLRAIELCSLLSRTAIEGGAQTDSILKLNNAFLKNLQQVNSLDTLCLKLQEIVESFSESMFHPLPNRNSDAMRKACAYIAAHFNEQLTLETVADEVHLHPAYFSTIFKQSCGSSFKEYLNMVRIEESKRLLINTDYSIIDIAVACGFEDQGYFSKVFKKYTGMTPKQFR